MDCLFCQIVKREVSSEIIYEDKEVIAFKDINPKALFHFLIVPKKHITSVNELEDKDEFLMGKLILVAKRIAQGQELSEKGYKLVFNVGRGGGQLINHIHLHLLSGRLTGLP